MKRFFFPLFFLFPSLVWAVGNLDPPSNNLSINYLGSLFGMLDKILPSTGSQALSNMFRVFNVITLVAVSMLWVYTSFIEALNTASDGDFLERKRSSMWLPLRIVLGTVLLYPKASGYSLIQVIVMYLVVQGVETADKVWNRALDYLQRNGTMVERVQSVTDTTGKTNNSFLIDKAKSILKSEVCMMTLYNTLQNQASAGYAGLVPSFTHSIEVTGKGPDDADTGKPIDYTRDIGGYIQFPGWLKDANGGVYERYRGACGYVSWNLVQRDNKKAPLPMNRSINNDIYRGVSQMMLNLQPMAETIASQLAPVHRPWSLDHPPEKTPIVTLDPQDTHLFWPGELLNTTSDYFAIIKPALRQLADRADQRKKDFLNEARQGGWIMAGTYHYKLALLNQSIRRENNLAMPDNIRAHFQPNYDHGVFNSLADVDVITNLKNNLPANNGSIDQYAESERHSDQDPNANKYLFYSPNIADTPHVASLGNIVKGLMARVVGLFQGEQKALERQLQESLDQDADPTLALADMGRERIDSAEKIWLSCTSQDLI